MTEAKHVAALPGTQGLMAADQLVVCHAAIGQRHGAPGLDADPAPERKARPQYHRIQQVALEAHILRDRAVVERAGQGRDEVDVPGGSALQKAAARDLDQDLDLGRLQRSVPGPWLAALACVHSARLHSPTLAEKRGEFWQIGANRRRGSDTQESGADPLATTAHRDPAQRNSGARPSWYLCRMHRAWRGHAGNGSYAVRANPNIALGDNELQQTPKYYWEDFKMGPAPSSSIQQ